MSEEKLPVAVRKGNLELNNWANLDCHHLDNGQRVISQRSFATIVGFKRGGQGLGYRMASYLDQPTLKSRKIKKLSLGIRKPIEFKMKSGPIAYGYEATTLVEYCKAILEARSMGYMETKAAKGYALSCEAFIIGCAKVGIIAMIDEATGYIEDKAKTEYIEKFKEFIREEMREWEKEFPDQFFDMIYKIYGLEKKGANHPQFFGKFIRKYVYLPLANSSGAVLDQLDKKNPVVYATGGRKFKMHQFLTDEIGLPALRGHVWQVIGIGNSVRSKGAFDAAFERAFPRDGDQGTFDFDV